MVPVALVDAALGTLEVLANVPLTFVAVHPSVLASAMRGRCVLDGIDILRPAAVVWWTGVPFVVRNDYIFEYGINYT